MRYRPPWSQLMPTGSAARIADLRGSELRWWRGRTVSDRPVLGVRGGPLTGLARLCRRYRFGSRAWRGQRRRDRLAGQRGGRTGIAAAVIWLRREQIQVKPGLPVPAGAAVSRPEAAPTNHSAVAVFDDVALAEGTALYAELALRRLGGPVAAACSAAAEGSGRI